jgi:hypothetical protein
MADTNQPKKGQRPKAEDDRQAGAQETERRQAEQDSIEDDPAVERGERIDTGKDIARGGKEKGKVPGATDESEQDRK